MELPPTNGYEDNDETSLEEWIKMVKENSTNP